MQGSIGSSGERRPGSVTPGLAGRCYVDPAIYQREKDRLFYAKWLCAGREADLPRPGAFAIRQVADERILLVRGEDGALRGFYNVCRHRGSLLCESPEGRFPGRGIACPYHAWTYGFDGRLRSTPNMAWPPDVDRADLALHPVHVQCWEGFAWINLADHPPPLADELGALATSFARYRVGRLRRAHRVEYDVAANWKLLVENFAECYHCPAVHPELNRASHYLGGGAGPVDGEGAWRNGGWLDLSAGWATMSIRGERRRPALPGLTTEDAGRVYYNTVYPNFFLSLHPDYALAHTLWPVDPGRTRIVCEWLFDPDVMAEPGFDPGDAVEFWDLVNRQDWRVCELAQLGNASRAHRAGVHVDQEAGLRYFTRYWRSQLGDD